MSIKHYFNCRDMVIQRNKYGDNKILKFNFINDKIDALVVSTPLYS